MKRVAYLTAWEMVDPQTERSDAFEHVRSLEVLQPAFRRAGMTLEPVVWDGPDAQPDAFDAVLIGTPWDYWRKRDAFLGALTRFAAGSRLFNPLPMVRWNLDKTYLRELLAEGVPGIPTVWLDAPDAPSIRRAFEVLDSDDLVLKRRVGAGAFGQERVKRGESIPTFDVPILVQAFLPSILEQGETSLVYVDGALSHAVRKVPTGADYRIQSLYGGTELDHTATAAEMAVAERVMQAIRTRGWGTPVYARVDLVWVGDAPATAPVVIEVELVEPYLYPDQGPELGVRLAEAVRGRLHTSATSGS